MVEFGAKAVQRLRQATGAGMMDAKRALGENDGDFDAAANWLREKGLAKSVERADRANEQGAIAAGSTAAAAALVELRCETDFVAKSPDFVALVEDLADAVATKGEAAVGMGSKWDDAAMKSVSTGGFFSAGPQTRHFAQCKGDTVLQVHGVAPLGINFVGADEGEAKKP